MRSQERLQSALKRWNCSGQSWRAIGLRIGRTKGWTWFVAHGQIQIDESKAEEILAALPAELLWAGPLELDSLVLHLLSEHGRLTGRQLASICGTIDRTIRRSIKRLRDDGHKIDGSIALPRGYRLED